MRPLLFAFNLFKYMLPFTPIFPTSYVLFYHYVQIFFFFGITNLII
jgi:hypothetical protein